MTFIVKDKDNWLTFDRFVRGMEIVTTVEPVSHYSVATEFDTTEGAEQMIKEAGKIYDVSEYTVHNRNVVEQEYKEAKENEAREVLKEAWNNTPEDIKKKKIQELLNNKGPEAVKQWLEYVSDTSNKEE